MFSSDSKISNMQMSYCFIRSLGQNELNPSLEHFTSLPTGTTLTHYNEVILVFEFLGVLWSLLGVITGTAEEFD